MIKRLVYLIYYFKELDRAQLNTFLTYVSQTHKISRTRLLLDAMASSLKYNISILEYFQFHFYRLSTNERKTFAGTGFMYEYQLLMNPRSARKILSDKDKFLKEYHSFVRHQFTTIEELGRNPKASEILANPSGKIVLKHSRGQCGIGVEVRNANEFGTLSLIQRLAETKNDLVEEFVVQHNDLMKLSPSGLNTVRIVTQLEKNNEVIILAARLRISVNSVVDNLAAGNLAAPINLETGVVEGPGVYSDITRSDEFKHPITGQQIVGFQVPFWAETIKMIKAAAKFNTSNRSVGWDVAITNRGPELIEANHDWCKLLWQLPVKKGLKPILESFLYDQKK
jgi:hypothetical protein